MSRLSQSLQESLWLITPERFAAIHGAADAIESGRMKVDATMRTKAEEPYLLIEGAAAGRSKYGAARGARGSDSKGAVLVVPFVGVIYPRGFGAEPFSGVVDLQATMHVLRRAWADPGVSSIIGDFGTPGGLALGVPEFATEVRSMRGRKPMTACVNFQSASAGYYIASQFDEVVASPSATLGSIGIVSEYVSAEKRIEDMGFKVQTLRYPDKKAEADGIKPLSDEAMAFRMAQIRKLYDQFETDIAKGLDIGRGTVGRNFGQGRSLDADEAVRVGMAHRVATLHTVLLEHASGRAAKQPAFRRSQGRPGMLDELPPLNDLSHAALGRAEFRIEADRRAQAKAHQDALARRWGIPN